MGIGNRGALVAAATGKWVFGGYERGSKKVFIVAVENRKAQTLLNVIKKWILPGTTIISNCWKAYNCLNNEGYKHSTVNHSYNFIDPDTSAHTESIKRTWSDIRQNISRYGNKEEDLTSYLAEYLFKRSHTRAERIDAMFQEIAKFKIVNSQTDSIPSTA
uniref:uncharacterized protein LOC117610669 n=1 Tax=Osmia lignaria TaxID=473952 RepID=UPI001478A407|nr:uncharacterized protein LOC117610669 [Osmia lignaria]